MGLGAFTQFRSGALGVSLAAALSAALPATPGLAQTPQLPGLVVTIPGAPVAAPQPIAPPPVAQPVPTPADKPIVKAKPKPAQAAANKVANANPGSGAGKGGQAILVLINDDPITAYEVEQRQKLMALQSNIGQRAQENMKRLATSEETQKSFRAQAEEIIKANQGKSREQIMALIEQRKAQFAQSLQRQALEGARASVLPGLKKNALEELIEERLKLQEAKKLNVNVDDAQVDGVLRGIAERNKMTPAQFSQHIAGMGADVNSMKARFRAQIGWSEVVRRKFTPQIAVNQRDVTKYISNAAAVDDEVELQLQRVTLTMSGKLDQKVMAQRYEEADRLRASFGGCKSTAAAAAKIPNAKYEDLGLRKPATVPEPTRTLLLNATDGEIVPPNMASGGLELYIVCGRKVLKADEQKRTQATQELQQKEFEILAKRHLRDLKQDAHIEYR